jgi:phosphoribosylformimino-5-aminoimidazole carboxamide ribotide isomerase
MSEFAVIPVLDLKGGLVVHARAGNRTDYRPIETPHGPASDPLAIARGLLAVAQSPVLYIADLDSIARTGDHFQLCRELAAALAGTALWIDAGFGDVSTCAFWLPLGAILVIGSETIASLDAWQDIRAAFGKSLVLSLDFDGHGFRGPQALLSDAALWPDRVIVMTLSRVGVEGGPDIDRLSTTLKRAGPSAVYIAGGVRHLEDLQTVATAGARGALVATALHLGALTQKEIAAFLRKRRS